MSRYFICSIVLLLAGFTNSAHAERRVALVIGNSAYQHISPLENPTNDASLLADTLKDLGFALVGGGVQLDLDKATLDGVVQSFGQKIQGADVALFYFAGHGVQVRGSNYLVPINANPTREADVDFQMVDVNVVLNQMQGSGTRLNLVILDACRNNPFGGRGLRSSEGGLAQMRAPEGTLISYATQPGSVAQDGDDGHSPYTRALATTVRRAGLDVFQTFNEVGLAVKRSTGGSQQPWVSSSPIDGSFYFVSPVVSTASPPPIPPQQEARLTDPSDTPQPDIVTDCDRLAANPADPRRPRGLAGVRPNQIDVVPALAACDAAMTQYPDVARFIYQAGRVASFQRDYLRARELYEKAAGKGYPASYYNIGFLYAQGNGVTKDYAEARRWYEKALAANDPVALSAIGVLYEKGNGVPQDYLEARRWFEKGAAAGSPPAMANLGRLYRDGNGVTRDFTRARKWLEQAANANDAGAMNGIGYLYEKGNGVTQDFAEARHWYEKASAVGATNAMINLGNLYRDGRGVTKDSAEARKWFEKAAALGDAGGMTSIGYLYERADGVAQDYAEARKWYEKAASAGEPVAMRDLGIIYRDGRGVPKNYTEARKWFEKGAAGGDRGAMNNLGLLYAQGYGVPKNYAEARTWYEKSAAAGDAVAMRNLGGLYAGGYGVAKDYTEARKWYEMAVAAGDEAAKTSLRQLDSGSRH
jgi:TPR repeat protein